MYWLGEMAPNITAVSITNAWDITEGMNGNQRQLHLYNGVDLQMLVIHLHIT